MSQHPASKPIAFDAYEQLAESFAAQVDSKPHNADYERPTMLALLPDVRGLRVLDAGCGPGVYAEWLVQHGAQVVAVDASAKMVSLAQQRLGDAADVRQMDLGAPLDAFADATFDVVLAPLALDYIEDWNATFGEFWRVLRPGGHFVFSVGHPFADFVAFKSENYFATEQVQYTWTGFGGQVQMPSYRRPLQALITPLLAAGFVLEALVEPQPTAAFARKDPKEYAKLQRQPGFLCVRARKGQA